MRILIVKLSSLGDVIQTMPVVCDMQALVPGAVVDWAVEEAFAPLVQRVTGVTRVLALAQRRWRKQPWSRAFAGEKALFRAQLQACTYDAVIDFQGLIKSALVARQARLSPRGFRATYANRSEACAYEWPVRYLLDRAVPMESRLHAVQRYRMLASRALGYAVAPHELKTPQYGLQVSPTPHVHAVFLAHGTTRADNRWPVAHWIDLAQRLAHSGFEIWLPQADASEAQWAADVAQALGTAARVLARMPLPALMDVMATVHGVIGVDSGLSHLAVALDLPHVQIFSQPRAWRAGPVGRTHQVAVGGCEAPSVDTVWSAWQAVSHLGGLA